MIEEAVNQESFKQEAELAAQRTRLSGPLGEQALSIGVFCSARDLADSLTEPARELARMIGEQGHDLVWGGSDIGTMHVITEAARGAGAKIIGVTTDSLSRSQHKTADEMITTEDLSERKMIIVERSDALVVLPGGTGTLDEVADVIERKKFGHHYKPIIFLNSDGFYEGLKLQFDRMETEGMLNRPLVDIVDFVTTPKEAMDLIMQKQSEHMSEIFEAHHMTEHSQITGGHSGALLYRTRSSEGKRSVIKVSNDKMSTKEVKSNIKAYQAILEAGLSQIVPDIEVGEDHSGRKYIVMPDLGETFTFQARSEAGADYSMFLNSINETFNGSLQQGGEEHLESLKATIAKLRQYQASLKTGSIAEQKMLDMIDEIDIAELTSDQSSFFLLDFTPDNIFIHDGQVQFIDPWEQSTYRGSPIPGLAEFHTLARDVYELPGVEEATALFDETYDLMGKKLGLTKSKVRKQILLGNALQHSLSAFIRMQSDPSKARQYYQRSLDAVEELVGDTK